MNKREEHLLETNIPICRSKFEVAGTVTSSTEKMSLASCQVMCHYREAMKTKPTSNKVLENKSVILKFILVSHLCCFPF